MFLARATFEVDIVTSGAQARVRLVAVEGIREVPQVPSGQFATYAEITRTLTSASADWAMYAERLPELRRQYHVLQFARREELYELVAATTEQGRRRAL